MNEETLTEQEIAQKLEVMRENAILELHEWDSAKGHGFVINPDGTVYDSSWFLGFNSKENRFGMCTSLEKKDKLIDCDLVKAYLEDDVMIFTMEYDTNFRSDGGCDIIVKFDEKNKYSNNMKLYKKINEKIKTMID